MKKESISFSYEVFDSAASLPETDRQLLEKAGEATQHAHAPYSQFFVGAAALMQNKKIITGSNQENASSPAGLCAERTLLAAVASLYPDIPVQSIAISYFNKRNGKSDHPIAPCGICRQSLLEYETTQQQPIRLILGGMRGEVLVIANIKALLPLSFSESDIR